jgi:hypothetical protein
MLQTHARRLGSALTAALLLCLAPPAVRADHFAILPAVNGTYEQRDAQVPTRREQQIIVDLFFSGDYDRLRVLAELQGEDDGADLERAQVGWRLTPRSSLWLGRFHNPIGFWNTHHHHGHYFETTIGRPRIVEFEDEGGPLPIHVTGFLFETGVPMGDGELHIDAALGSGSKLGERLEPVDLLRGAKLNKRAETLRLLWRPDATRETQFGVFGARTRIPVVAYAQATIEQTTSGLFANIDGESYRVLGEFFHLTHSASTVAALNWPSYWAGHVQLEYKLVPGVWTPYARFESLSRRLDGPYAATFPLLSKDRQLAGVRWDFRANQALKLQVFREALVDRRTVNGVVVQWSALF